MRVLLINPSSDATSPVLPFGLAWIAAVLEKNGIDVKIIDAWSERLDFPRLKKNMASLNPDIIGITIMSPLLISAMKTVDLAKSVCPNSMLVVGGAHPSALPQECLEDNPNIDVAVIGEGEYALLDLVRARNNAGNLQDINGIAYRKNSSIILTPPRLPIDNLDSLPLPARHLFPMHKYKTHPPYGRRNPYVAIMTSRGCPFNCSYCSNAIFGRRLRMRSVNKIIEELEFLIKEYKVKEIHFYDDSFTADSKRIKSLCDEIICRKLKIIWSCTTRLDLVNKDMLQLMRKAGCWLISYGIESGCQEVLDRMSKGINLEQMKESFLATKKVGIKTLGFFMIGLPSETRDDIQKTIDFCFELDPDFIAWGMLRIFPGSSLYKELKEGNMDGQKIYRYSALQEASTNMPFGERGFFITYEGSFTEPELRNIIKQVYRRFYFRPKYILRQLLSLRSLSELWQNIFGGLEVFKWIKLRIV